MATWLERITEARQKNGITRVQFEKLSAHPDEASAAAFIDADTQELDVKTQWGLRSLAAYEEHGPPR